MKMPIRPVVNVLVAVVVLALLIALLFPAVEKIRTPAARTQTNNNLKQCALAVHNFHDMHNRLPDAWDKVGADFGGESKSLWFHLLPYIEAGEAHKNSDAMAVVPALFAPSDPFMSEPFNGLNSFAANIRVFGHETIGVAADQLGVAVNIPAVGEQVVSGMSLKDIKDGTGNVIMMCTRYADCAGKRTFYASHPADPVKLGAFALGGKHSQPAAREGEDFIFQVVPRQEKCDNRPYHYGHAFGSGGMSVAMCDATVRNLTPTISVITFQRAICPNDGAPLDADWSD